MTSLPLSDDELNALLDEQGTATALGVLRQRLAQDPDGQARLALWQAQGHALRNLHNRVMQEAVPLALLQAAQRPKAPPESANSRWRFSALAASLLLSFFLGWLVHGQPWDMSPTSSASLAQRQPEREFVHQASLAHSVYVPEVRHPVEVGAQEQVHLLQWLSKRLGKPLRLPDLAAQGFALVGGRLLPGERGARAQFMFQDATGVRLTLYIGAIAASDGPAAHETGFRFAPQAGVPSFYWVDQGFGYALSGQVTQPVLLKLADAVYRQLG